MQCSSLLWLAYIAALVATGCQACTKSSPAAIRISFFAGQYSAWANQCDIPIRMAVTAVQGMGQIPADLTDLQGGETPCCTLCLEISTACITCVQPAASFTKAALDVYRHRMHLSRVGSTSFWSRMPLHAARVNILLVLATLPSCVLQTTLTISVATLTVHIQLREAQSLYRWFKTCWTSHTRTYVAESTT